MGKTALGIAKKADMKGARTRIVATGASIDGGGKIIYGDERKGFDGIGLDVTKLAEAPGYRVDLHGLRANDTRELVCTLTDEKAKSSGAALDSFIAAAAKSGPARVWQFKDEDRAELLIVLAKMRKKVADDAPVSESDPVPAAPAPEPTTPTKPSPNGAAKKGAKSKK